MVELGRKVPAWGISRWDSPGLRFLPDDGEGFTLRGDRRQLFYKGRKRSHRFTILGDNSFEYDCILNKEPDSNTVMLRLEGAEQFDFFRQPDWLKNPLLAGSYAVYKKETFVGEGTGKLCHIHRPKIIDAAGRWVWGDFSVSGDRLCITIPPEWLSRARYPVIVDPVIGTTTVGSQTHWNNVDNESYDQLFFEVSIGVNRFLISESFTGTATAYVYAYESDYYGRCKPVLYSDNGGIPLTRKSKSEGSFDIAVGSGKPTGWRSTTFQTNGTLAQGSYIWFGLFCDWFAPRFDYEAKCYRDYWDSVGDDIPETYPLYQASNYYDFKLSMYFSYTSAQNYTRTLIQGVTLSDSRKLAASYKRSLVMDSGGITLLGHTSAYYRKHVADVNTADMTSRLRGFFRAVTENIKSIDVLTYCRDFLRSITNTVRPSTGETRKLDARRDISAQAGITDSTARQRGFIRTLLMAVDVPDYAGKMFNWFRTIQHEVSTFDQAGHLGDYLRGLYTEAGSMAETHHTGEYHRLHQDIVSTQALSLRYLIIFIRLVTVGFIRDYLIPRFLRSKEEIVLKSKVSREIELDSRIH